MSQILDDARLGMPPGGCAKCSRAWPAVTFREVARQLAANESPDIICDQCRAMIRGESRGNQVAAKIDEAQAGRAPVVVRQVVVTGIKSGTNVTGYRYPTHVGREPLIVTDLVVTFENGTEYLYDSVPVIVCEAWMGDTSFGTYFIQQIKTSYDFKKVT